MGRVGRADPLFEDLPLVLTIAEAAGVLRISRSSAYLLARRYLDSGGAEGLPVLCLGGTSMRVPKWALLDLVRTGRVVRLSQSVGHSTNRARGVS
jgi:hypothetical protein